MKKKKEKDGMKNKRQNRHKGIKKEKRKLFHVKRKKEGMKKERNNLRLKKERKEERKSFM